MKKVLFIAGLGTLLYGSYRYFKGQVNLALTSDYGISDFKVITLNDEKADITADIKLSNRSSFEIEVLEYDISLFYKETQVGHTQSGKPFKIYAEDSVKITASGTVLFNDVFKAAGPFLQNVLQRKPINIQVSGHVKVKFLGIPYTLEFDKEEFNYSMDLLKDMGLSEKYEKLQSKLPFLRKI